MSTGHSKLAGQEGSHQSASCQVTSFGTTNPVAGMLASRIIEQINSQQPGLQVAQASDVSVQSGGAKGKGPVGRG